MTPPVTRSRPVRKFVRPFLHPQPVDKACAQPCGPVRSVGAAATNGDRCSSTSGVGSRGTTRGYPGGRRMELSAVRLTVDRRPAWRPSCTHAVHRGSRSLSSTDPSYPQVPQDRRRRWFISLIQIKSSSVVWMYSQPGSATRSNRTGQPPGRGTSTPQDRIKTFPQEASHEVPG
jgi:hypothetical protein